MSAALARLDLRWFFTEAAGDLGLSAQDYQPRGARSSSPDGAAAARHHEAAVIRWTEVIRRLRALPEGHERVLRVAYGPLPPGWPRGLERLYELAGVAALLLERARLATSPGNLRPVVLDGVLDRETQRYVRSGALVPLPAPPHHEGLVEAARTVITLKPEKAETLRLQASAALRLAMSLYLGATR